MRTASPHLARRAFGFTLIEVLVVVAIIALLISILLPSLSRARKQTKALMCQTHLREFGNAMQMYLMDAKDRLPGPLHPAMLKDTRNVPPAYVIQKTFYLPAMLRRYFSESVKGSASMADAIATCADYPIPDKSFPSVWGTGPNPFNYCVNTWTNTKPDNYYFGFTHAGVKDYTEWYNTYGNTPVRLDNYGPKKLSRINLPSREWWLADAFRRPYQWENSTLNASLPRGSWPREDNSTANSGNVLPLSPFHLDSGYASQGATQSYKGKANTIYFDLHVESQRGFGRYLFNRDEF